jgi:hypothetical protein
LNGGRPVVSDAPFGAGLVGHVTRCGPPQSGPLGSTAGREGAGLPEALCFPLVEGSGEAIGALELLDKRGMRQFGARRGLHMALVADCTALEGRNPPNEWR